METSNFLELKDQFELQVKKDFQFELLELQYTPYAFGSGMMAYKIKGRIIKIVLDGRDEQIELMISPSHAKYDRVVYNTIYTGTTADFIEEGIAKLRVSI